MNRSAAKNRSRKNNSALMASVQKTYERFLKIRGHPREIALGFGLGLFIGMTPFMGLHTIAAVAVAALFKWNKISAAISVWITNAVTAPIIYGITYLVGAWLMGIERAFNLKEINSLSAVSELILKTPEIVWAMIVGGMVIGLPLAIIGYYVAFSITSRYQEEIKAKITRSKEKLAHKRQMRKAKSAMIDAASQKLHADNPGGQNPTDAKSNPSAKASEH
jgi:uncharacterized protein (TIGR03546 family)